MEKKRILHVIFNMEMAGAQNFIMNIYRNIDREKVQFDFIIHEDGAFDDEIKKLGGKIYKLDYLTKVGPIKYKKNLISFFENHKEYKIVHSHINQVTGLILEAAKKANVSIRIAHSHSSSNLNNFVIKTYKKYLQTKINKNANYKFACSKQAGEWLYKNDDFEVINNAIDVEKFKYDELARKSIRKELDIEDQTILLGHVGRFMKVKNHDFLIEVFYKYNKEINSNSKLLLIGEGELLSNIKEKVESFNIKDKVIFVERVNNPYDYYNAMDMFLFPSLYEGLPLTLVEAQCSGLQCLISETITDEVIGTNLITKIKLNVEEWVRELDSIKLLKRKDYEEQIIEMGYDARENAKKLQQIYEGIGEL